MKAHWSIQTALQPGEKKERQKGGEIEQRLGEKKSEWFWFFEMPFEFDNVPLASLQIISLFSPLGHLSPPALYNHKYQGRSLLYPGYSFTELNKLQACLRAQ